MAGTIENIVALFTVQKACYWGNPVPNDEGGWTFDAPVEIECRWEDKQELMEEYDNNKFSSQATVLVKQDIDRRSYMYMGRLTELQAIATANGWDINKPQEFPTAFIVIQFTKTPMVFEDNDFVRQAFLFNQG